jgi:hypothetical protein
MPGMNFAALDDVKQTYEKVEVKHAR